MAKMTETQLRAFTASYVDATKQANGTFTVSKDNLYGLVDKTTKIVSLAQDYRDELGELEGDEMPYGKSIEETMIDLVMPTVYGANGTTPGVENEENATAEGAYDVAPAYPSVEEAAYSYSLNQIKVKTTLPYDYIDTACNDAATAGKLVADVTVSLNNSEKEVKNAIKRQLLGNAIDKAEAAGLKATLAIPTDEATSESFIQTIKTDVEEASFSGENKSLSKAYIGAAPELTLYVKRGVMPVIEVKALAGAIQKDELAIPAKIVVVKDFGTTADSNVWAFLADTRGLKLHTNYKAVRSKENADGDFVNFVEHDRYTAFISKHVYFKAYTTAE